MAAQLEPNLQLFHSWARGEDNWDTGMNENLLKLGALVHLAVESMSTTSAPASPAEGSRYIVPTGAAAGWAGSGGAGRLAHRTGGTWKYYLPQAGWRVYNRADQRFYFYDGMAWLEEQLELGISDVTGLQSALDGKAAVAHTHSISNVTGLQSALDGKAAAAHSHGIAGVIGLQELLDEKQPLDGTLTALAALDATAGLLEQTGADTFVRRLIGVATSTSIPTRADADARYAAAAHTHAWNTLTGTPTTLGGYGITDAQPLDSDLTAIAALTTTTFGRGLLTESSAATLKGTLGLGNVENTSLSSWAGSANLTTLGTITSGTWQGTVIGAAYGGAGTVSGLMKANGSGAVSAAAAGTDYVAPGVLTGSGLTMATARILGRSTAGTGAIEEISIGSGLSLSGGVLSASGGGGGLSGLAVGNIPYADSSTSLAASPLSRIDASTVQVAAINGSASANGALTLQGTSNATRTTSYLNLQPNGGSVGIGTTTPSGLFYIQSNAYALSWLRVFGNGGGYSATSGIGIEMQDVFGLNQWAIYPDNDGASIKFERKVGGTAGASFVVGANSAVFNVPVSGTRFMAGAGSLFNPSFYMGSSGDEVGLYLPATNILGFITDRTERARIDASGNFGINTISPAAQLDVRPASASTIGQIVRLASAQTANALNIETSAGSALLTVGADGSITQTASNAATNSVVNVARFGVNSTGTPATGFGARLSFGLESSTTNDQDAAAITALWTDATHASRSAALVFSTVNGAGALTERWRIRADGVAIIAAGNIQFGPLEHVVYNATGTALAVRSPGGILQIQGPSGNNGASLHFNSRGFLNAPSDGVMTFTDNAGTSFSRLQFGGTTSSFPALKRSATGLQARLADDSAPTYLQHTRLISGKSVDYTVLAADTHTLFTNSGATGAVNFTLPTAAAGLQYTFYVATNQTLTITAGASTTIRSGASVTAAAGNISASTDGNLVRLVAINSTTWVAETITGTWAFS